MASRFPSRNDEALSRHCHCRRRRRPLLLAEARPRRRNDLRHFQSLSPALCYWLRSSVHLQPAEPRLDPPRLSLHGDGCGIHSRAACEARASRKIGRRSFNFGRNFSDYGDACGVKSLPLHSKVHNPGRRNDGRKRHDCHRRHHEETQRRYQNSIQPRGDGVGSRSNAAASDAPASEESIGAGIVAGGRQREDGGADLAPGGDDGADNGRSVSNRSHSAANCGDEFSDRSFDGEQYNVHLPLLAFLLHRRLPVGNGRLCLRLISFAFLISVFHYFLEFKCKFN